MNRLPLLSDKELSTLTNGLLVAAEKFDANAAQLRAASATDVSPAATMRLAEQFILQAKQSRELAAKLDEESEDAQ